MLRYSNWLGWLLLVFSVAAHARQESATLSFTPPTERIDGTTLAPGELTRFEFRCVEFIPSGGVAQPCMSETVVVFPGVTTATVLFQVPDAGGAACFEGRAFAGDLVSGWSADVCKDYAPTVPPKPPTIVTVSTVAYELQKKTFGPRFVQIGTIKLGVPCRAMLVTPYWEVPKSEVKITKGNYKGGVTAGKCA
jgi:hypothetical protein